MTRHGEAGFSLLEVLVVLALLATMTGLTMLSFGSGERTDRLEAEARLLANRLSMASDEALLTGADLSLRLDGASYGVDVWSDEGNAWRRHPSEMLGSRHVMAEGIAVDVEPSLGRLPIRPDAVSEGAEIVFSGSGGAWRVSNDGLASRAARVAP
ncbi:MAG: prepilin-type N-terminal cleavage/methylation domain-containing protein [Rhizobiaceae bacterium]|nr:prepilin-type N-terminal cleavage/methylation domain-containing protein [Rhizobiaceae bacterium]